MTTTTASAEQMSRTAEDPSIPAKPPVHSITMEVHMPGTTTEPEHSLEFTRSLTVGRNSSFIAPYLPAKTVSREHFQIVFDEMLDVYWLVNLCKNGTVVRERRKGMETAVEMLLETESARFAKGDHITVLVPLQQQAGDTAIHANTGRHLELRFQI